MNSALPTGFRAFWVGLRVQLRVIGTLMVREFILRWGRRNLGFAWLFAEPLVFSFPVLTMWISVRPSIEHGLPMVALLWTGYLPLLLFRHTTGSSLYLIRSNAGLLYHRQITPLDIFTSHTCLLVMGEFASSAFSFTIFYLFGFLSWPADVTLMMVGFLYMAWWGVAVALILVPLSERSHLIEHIWAPISYMYVFLSGFMFIAEWLPTPVRNLALTFDPPVHAYEMIRSGMLGPRFQPFYDMSYLTHILAVMTCIGLWLLHNVRKHLEIIA